MPWTKTNYPPSMKNLTAAVRHKAVEIANALLGEGMEEGIAIATAISRAKDWAVNRGKKIKKEGVESKTTDVKKHGEDRYVIPHKEGWAVKKEGKQKAEKVFDTQPAAVKNARAKVKKANATLTIMKKEGKMGYRTSYNPNKRAPKQKA